MGQPTGFVCKFVRLCAFFFLIGGSTAWGQVRPRVVQAVGNEQRITLKGNVHPLARAEFDRGAVVESQPMTRMLLLLKRGDDQEAALQQYLESQQDKSSANYHAWLTPEEFGANYGPADADVQAVADWLTSQGFTVEKVYSGKTVIEFSGTAGGVQSAFGTAVRNFGIGGKTYVANANDPQIPAALAPVVAGIVSLNNFPRQSQVRVVGQAHKNPGKPGLEPLLTFPLPAGNGSFYGMGPGDFATIYHITPLLSGTPKIDGTGQTIAIVGETNINVKDVQSFRQMFGLPANFDGTNVILNGEDPGFTSPDEEAEADLDVEWSGAVAPGATVKFVVSASTPASAGIDLSALYIVEHNLAGAMSESYGICESSFGSAGNAFYNALWQQAAAQGITVMVSTGDNGSAGCDDFNTATAASLGLAVNGLASTPYNVAVGGTDFDQVNKWSTFWSATNSPTGTSALSYIPEISWNDSCAQIGLSGCGSSAPSGSLNIVAGSGGASGLYGKPTWQLGVTGMPNDSHRDLPDVSLFASSGFNETGYIYCQSDMTMTGAQMCDISNVSNFGLDFGIVGGTSVSSPAFAGIMALVNQYQANNGGTNRQGNANNVLYALAKKANASCASSVSEAATCIFNDVTKGNSVLPNGGVGVGTNSVPCTGGTPNCSATLPSQTGVLVVLPGSTTEAWMAGTGYDLATGLGSVNVNNLATQWKTVNRVATTTALTLSKASGISHGTGENVGVNITVTPTSATGSVSLIAKLADGTTQGLDQFTLVSGKVTNGTTNSLPGGTYTVTVHYAGDGTNAPSDSAAVNVTVAPESSQTFILVPTFDLSGNSLNGNASTFVYGTPYIIRLYVTDHNAVGSSNGPPSPTCYTENRLTCPSGAVALTSNGAALDGGTFQLNNAGYSRDIAPSLTGGTYTLSASYGGDGSYQSSTSGASTLTITPAPTSQQFNDYPSFVILGQPFTLGTMIGTGVAGVAPTGTVTFYDGATALPGAVTMTASGVGSNVALYASETTSINTAGSHTVTAVYSGDNSYRGSTSAPATFKALYPVTISVTENSTNINYGQSLTITAKVTSSGKTPAMSGQLQFFGSTVITDPITTSLGIDASGNQVLTGTITTVPQYSESVSVNYTGDPNYQSGSGNGDFITVNIPDFSLPNGTQLNITPGQTQTSTQLVTPLSNTPSTVTLSLANGPGTPGFTISLAPTTVNLNGSPVPVTLTVTTIGDGNIAAAGKMQLRKSGIAFVERWDWWSLGIISVVLCIYLLGIPNRRRRFRAAFFAGVVGMIGLGLGCGGGGGGGGNGGGGGGGLAATSTTITTTSPKIAFGRSTTLTATVTGKNPTGSVTFYQNGVAFGSTVPVVAVQASLIMPNFGTPMIVSFTASYSGDAQNRASQTATGVTEVFQGSLPVLIQGQTGGLTRMDTVDVVLQ
jgi:hypothetical protein